MSPRAREWTAAHLPWITIALTALWLPPVVVALAAGVGIVQRTGFPALTDPSAFLPAIELTLMIAALILNARLRGPGLRDVLTALAESTREELDMRRRVEAARRSTRRSAQIVVGVPHNDKTSVSQGATASHTLISLVFL